MLGQIKKRLSWFLVDLQEVIQGLTRMRDNPSVIDGMIDVVRKLGVLVRRVLGLLGEDAPGGVVGLPHGKGGEPPRADPDFVADPRLTLTARWEKPLVLADYSLDPVALLSARIVKLELRDNVGEWLDEMPLGGLRHPEGTWGAKVRGVEGPVKVIFSYQAAGEIFTVSDEVVIPAEEPEPEPAPDPAPEPEPDVVEKTFTGDPGLRLDVDWNGSYLMAHYSLKKEALIGAAVAGVVVKKAETLETLDEVNLVGTRNNLAVFAADIKGATGKIKIKFYYRSAGSWFNEVRYVMIPPLEGEPSETVTADSPPVVATAPASPAPAPEKKNHEGCKVGINSAWLYDLDREPSNIFHPGTLDLKPGFIDDMAHLDMFRFMNLNNANHNELAGDASVIASPDDLQNRKSAGWTGSVPGMNPDLIVRVANEAQVIPWVNLTHNTLLKNHRDFIYRWAVALKKSSADTVVVEVSNEPWNNAGPFVMQSLAFAKWAAENLSLGGAATGTNEWGEWASPLHAMAGALYFLGVLDEIMRPVLGDKLVTVLNSQSVTSVTNQWPMLIEQADYRPDMIAIATYYSAPSMNLGIASSQMRTLKRRWDNARKMADQCGVMLGAYEAGSEQHYNTPENMAWAISSDNGLMLEKLFKHIVSVADYAAAYLYACRDQFGITREPGKSTPAWEGFLRGLGR